MHTQDISTQEEQREPILRIWREMKRREEDETQETYEENHETELQDTQAVN